MAAIQKNVEFDLQENDRQGGAAADHHLLLSRRDALKLGAAMAAATGFANARQAIVGSNLGPGKGPEPKIEGAPGPVTVPPIFPIPQQMELSGAPFLLDEDVVLLLPAFPSENDRALGQFLREELSDRFGFTLKTQYSDRLPASGRFILLGSVESAVVRQFCTQHQLNLTPASPGSEGYLLRADQRSVVVGGSDAHGAFYGLQSLRQLLGKQDHCITVPGIQVRDWPDKAFRGVKVFLPGRESIPFFKCFVANFLALYKFNALIVQLNACMRLDRHPEVNAGWVEFARDVNYCRRNYPRGPLHGREQNSSHQDCCDGGFLEKSEVADLVQWTGQNYLEFVPEIPSMTHSYYLLASHPELSEVPGDTWPDTYCTCHPETHRLLFDVMDEFVEVTRPRMVHAAHDEWFAPFGLCGRCAGRDPGELYGQDVRKIHEYLAGKNIQMAMWGDYLLESVRGAGLQPRVAPDGWRYHAPGAMTPRQVEALVPKDILVFNWFWEGAEPGRKKEAELEEFGFRQVYGNMEPHVENYCARSSRVTILGGAPSLWVSPTEFNLSKDFLFSALGCSGLLWSSHVFSESHLYQSTQKLLPTVRPRLTGATPPSHTDGRVVPVELVRSLNATSRELVFGVDLREMATGPIRSGAFLFELPGASTAAEKSCLMVGTYGTEPNPLPREAESIKIGQDVTSLIFLHACARAANNREAFRVIWDEADSADLLGWYEVVYEDGLPEIIPIRYGVNILEWNWIKGRPARAYCAAADEVICGQTPDGPITFFAFEWASPRLGKIIQEVRLHGSRRFRGAVDGFENAYGPVIASNAVILKALSMVTKRA
jgi:hypothetical protein